MGIPTRTTILVDNSIVKDIHGIFIDPESRGRERAGGASDRWIPHRDLLIPCHADAFVPG